MKRTHTNLNIRLPVELLEELWKCCKANDTTVSQVVRELMRAYIELCGRAKGRRLPRIDLVGFYDTGYEGSVMQDADLSELHTLKTGKKGNRVAS